MEAKTKWPMSDAEIKSSWRRCENKKKQVKILAELNAKTKPQVIDKLIQIGAMSAAESAKAKAREKEEPVSEPKEHRGRFTAAEHRKMFELRAGGFGYKQIAAKMGSTETSVQVTLERLRRERRAAWPVIERALRWYAAQPECTAEERRVLKREAERGAE